MSDATFTMILAAVGAATGIPALIIIFKEQRERFRLDNRVRGLERTLTEMLTILVRKP